MTVSDKQGQPFTLRFSHGLAGRRRATTCVLYVGVPDAAEAPRAGLGVATCGARDQFCRAVGRKVALDRALHQAALAFGLPRGEGRRWKRGLVRSYRRALDQSRRRAPAAVAP